MAWQRILGSAIVLLGIGGGCESSPGVLARNQFLQDPELFAAIARNGNQTGETTRGQKPDAKPPGSLLDVPPERPADAPHNSSTGTIRAVVNDQAILDEEVRAAAYGELLRASYLPEPERSRRSAEIYNETLNKIIEREIVLQKAIELLKKNGERFLKQLEKAAHEGFDKQVVAAVKKANNFKTDAEVERYFAEQGVALSSVRRSWERNFMEFEYLRNLVFPLLETRVNHQMIVDYYEKHPEEFQVTDNVKWQDLFVATAKHGSREETRAFAASLADRARKGADFVKLVKENDDGDSTLRDGDGVGSKRGEIKPAEAERLLFRMADGQVGDLIEMPSGFHVIRLVHRQNAGQLPFDEKVQKQIRDKLRNEVFQTEIKKIVRELKRKAVVVIAQRPNNAN
jgi:parvulin-like peptidyl-prolyl isomerase